MLYHGHKQNITPIIIIIIVVINAMVITVAKITVLLLL